MELLLPAYATTTAIPDPSCIFDLHHSSRQHQILNPLSQARDRTDNLMVPSRICFCCATTGTPILNILITCVNKFPFLLKLVGFCHLSPKGPCFEELKGGASSRNITLHPPHLHLQHISLLICVDVVLAGWRDLPFPWQIL